MKTHRLVMVVGGVFALACGGGAADPVPAPAPVLVLTAEDLAGEHFEKGAKVKAIRGKETRAQSASFLQQYGKLAQLKFADHNTGWVLVKAIDPPGAIQPYPEGDACAFEIGDKVRAPWSTSLSKFGGTIDELHGSMAHIQYDDRELDWALCDSLEAPAEAAAPKPAGGGGSSNADAVSKCKRKCTSSCKGSSNVSKCTGSCRRACDK